MSKGPVATGVVRRPNLPQARCPAGNPAGHRRFCFEVVPVQPAGNVVAVALGIGVLLGVEVIVAVAVRVGVRVRVGGMVNDQVGVRVGVRV